MSENTLVEKIKADAEKIAAEAVAAGESTVASIKKETETKLQALRDEHKVALKKQHDHLELVAVSRAKQSGKIALQQAKRDQIDTIFAEVVEDLVSQSAETYVAYFSKQVQETVPKEVTVTKVVAPTKRVEETKEILTQAGLKGDITESGTISAGLVVETTEGVYDITLDRLLSEQRSEIEMEVVKEVMS